MFECTCVDIIHPTFVRRRVVHGKQDHLCCECREVIPRGAQHEYVTGLWGEEWSTFRTCMVCKQIREDFMPCGWIYGNLWETLHDIYCGDTEWLQ